jgi:DnaJ-class molecular chaperone
MKEETFWWVVSAIRLAHREANNYGFSSSSFIIVLVVFFAICAFLYYLSSEVNKRRKILKYEQSYLNSLNVKFSNLLFEESNIYCDLIIDENQAEKGFELPIYNNTNGTKIRIQPGVLDGKKYRIQNIKIQNNNILFTVIFTIYVQTKIKHTDNLNSDIEEAFKILNVDRKASVKEIRNAYYKLAKKYHPDRNGGKYSEEMKNINNSYQLIKEQFESKS